MSEQPGLHSTLSTVGSLVGLITGCAAIVGFLGSWLSSHSPGEAVEAGATMGAVAGVVVFAWASRRNGGLSAFLLLVLIGFVGGAAAKKLIGGSTVGGLIDVTVIPLIGILSGVAGISVASVMATQTRRAKWKTCRDCAETVRAQAKKCRYCGCHFETT